MMLQEALRSNNVILMCKMVMKPEHFYVSSVPELQAQDLIQRLVVRIVERTHSIQSLCKLFGIFQSSSNVLWKYAIREDCIRCPQNDIARFVLRYARIHLPRHEQSSFKKGAYYLDVKIRESLRRMQGMERGLVPHDRHHVRKAACRILRQSMKCAVDLLLKYPAIGTFISFCAVSLWSHLCRRTRSGMCEEIAREFISMLSFSWCRPGTIARQVVLNLVRSTCFAMKTFYFEGQTLRCPFWSECVSHLSTFTSAVDVSIRDVYGTTQICNDWLWFPHNEERLLDFANDTFFSRYLVSDVRFVKHLLDKVIPAYEPRMNHDVIAQIYSGQLQDALLYLLDQVSTASCPLQWSTFNKYFSTLSKKVFNIWNQMTLTDVNRSLLYQSTIHGLCRYSLMWSSNYKNAGKNVHRLDMDLIRMLLLGEQEKEHTEKVVLAVNNMTDPSNLDLLKLSDSTVRYTVVEALTQSVHRVVTRVGVPILFLLHRHLKRVCPKALIEIIFSYLPYKTMIRRLHRLVERMVQVTKIENV